MDRFIPNRSSMDLDFAQYMLREGKKLDKDPTKLSPYQKRLREVFNIDPRRRILVFGNKRKQTSTVEDWSDASNRVKPRRRIPMKADRVMEAPDVLDDFYLNLLSWSDRNVLAVALGFVVYLWDASCSDVRELLRVDEDKGPVTSVSWAPDGRHIAVGLNNSEVQWWDTFSTSNAPLRTLRASHGARVGSMAWNKNILTTGSMDGQIIDHDLRVQDHIVRGYRGHRQEVCGLKWSESGQRLASGGNDNLMFIWDRSMASSRWLFKLKDHKAAVKALDWCPSQGNLLASGGGTGDHTIKFWNTQTGACLNSVETGSQVSALCWSKHELELLSSHGFSENKLILWKYPSMVSMADLIGHSSRVLHMAQSPDGCTVASLSTDETLMVWNVFEAPKQRIIEPFAYVNRIR